MGNIKNHEMVKWLIQVALQVVVGSWVWRLLILSLDPGAKDAIFFQHQILLQMNTRTSQQHTNLYNKTSFENFWISV